MPEPMRWEDYPEHTRQRVDALFCWLVRMKPILEERRRKREERERLQQ